MLKNVSRVLSFSQHFPPVHLEGSSREEAGLMAWPWHWGFLRTWVTVLFCLNSMPREHCIPDIPGDHKHPKVYAPPAWAGRSSTEAGVSFCWGVARLCSVPRASVVLGNHRTPVRSCQCQDGRELYHRAATLCYWECGVSNTWDTSLFSCFILLEVGKWADTVGTELAELMSKQFLTAKSNSKSKEEEKTRTTALVPLPIWGCQHGN